MQISLQFEDFFVKKYNSYPNLTKRQSGHLWTVHANKI